MNPPHCSSCGAAFLAVERAQPHPHCHACDITDWQNPRPVVVFLQPVMVSSGLGLAVARRGILPDKGAYVLPGGHLEKGETSVQAGVREFREEAGVTGLVHSASCRIIGDVPSTSHHHQLLFVVNMIALTQHEFDQLQDTDEMYEWAIRTQTEGPTLAWSTHETVVTHWLDPKLRPEIFKAGFLSLLGF
ncbi:8-oxo-dGTP diphosphatase [Brevundimonas phage vB_BpoS-Bambus]|nr:8-oxo-dGTP diphosphatase [Brevundimonas phage vB_BpoS-Bambus]